MKRMHSGDRESKQVSTEKQTQSNSLGTRKFSPKAQVNITLMSFIRKLRSFEVVITIRIHIRCFHFACGSN